MSTAKLPLMKRPADNTLLDDPYTKQVLQGLTDIRSKHRNFSPRTSAQLAHNIKLCDQILELKDKGEVYRQLSQQLVRANSFFQSRLDNEQKYREVFKQYQDLVASLYMLKYGDYLAMTCQRFRKDMMDAQKPKTKSEAKPKAKQELDFSGLTWNEFLEQMRDEEMAAETWERNGQKTKRPDTTILDLIEQIAYGYDGHDTKSIKTTISEYAARNGLAHSGIADMANKGHFDEIAALTVRDLHSLDTCGLKPDKEVAIRKAIMFVQKRYFARIEEEQNPVTGEWRCAFSEVYPQYSSVRTAERKIAQPKGERICRNSSSDIPTPTSSRQTSKSHSRSSSGSDPAKQDCWKAILNMPHSYAEKLDGLEDDAKCEIKQRHSDFVASRGLFQNQLELLNKANKELGEAKEDTKKAKAKMVAAQRNKADRKKKLQQIYGPGLEDATLGMQRACKKHGTFEGDNLIDMTVDDELIDLSGDESS